jgi:hypothetical protein
LGPGGLRSVVAESVLVKQQLLILNRSRQRSPNLRTSAYRWNKLQFCFGSWPLIRNIMSTSAG